MIVRSNNYILRTIDKYYLLICRTTPINGIWMFQINSTGKAIWDLLDSPRELGEIYNIFKEKFLNINEEDLNSISIYIKHLVNKGLINYV